MLSSKDYYIDLINSSKANKFTSLYHYSGVGFKKAKINQGIYRKTDNLLVGVLQWGCSAQEGIRLDRYVTNPITKDEYLELNRFCMADSEPRNAESQAIALGIKWIKQNRQDIRLLVSYAGRKEGNYGYIYQATNWEYLGYFISDGFWLLDGQERHQLTVWYHYKTYADPKLPFREGICSLYHDVRQTWSKQFIYIQRLDSHLNRASPLLPYPKPANEYPICTRIETYKRDDDYLNPVVEREKVQYYYEPDERLFSRRCLIRKGELEAIPHGVAIYSREGQLEESYESVKEAVGATEYTDSGIRNAIKSGKIYKNKFFRSFNTEKDPNDTIEVDYLCEIDGIRFMKQTEVADYCGVSRQAVSSAKQRASTLIVGKTVYWNFQRKEE